MYESILRRIVRIWQVRGRVIYRHLNGINISIFATYSCAWALSTATPPQTSSVPAVKQFKGVRNQHETAGVLQKVLQSKRVRTRLIRLIGVANLERSLKQKCSKRAGRRDIFPSNYSERLGHKEVNTLRSEFQFASISTVCFGLVWYEMGGRVLRTLEGKIILQSDTHLAFEKIYI